MPDSVRRLLGGEGGRPRRAVSQTLQGVRKGLRYRCRKVYEYTERSGKDFPLGDLPTVGKSPRSNVVGIRPCMCSGVGLETVQMLNAPGQQALPDGMQIRGSAVHEHTAPDTWTETAPDDPPVVEAEQVEPCLILREVCIILIAKYGVFALPFCGAELLLALVS